MLKIRYTVIFFILSLTFILSYLTPNYLQEATLEVYDISLVYYLWAWIFAIQIIVFIPSFIFRTEHYYDLTGANNPNYSSHPGYHKTDKSQIRIRNDWKKEDYAWEYTNDFIGNMALKCKQYYQNQYSKIYGRGGKKENLSYKYTAWYHEPKGVPGCVKKSIEKILNTGNSNAPYEFTAFNENLYG